MRPFTAMHNGETMGVSSPLSTLPWGTLRREDPVHEAHRSADNKSKNDGRMEGASGGGGRNTGDVEGFLDSVADNVDNFLADFLSLASPGGRSGTVDDFLTFVGGGRGSDGGSGGGGSSEGNEVADVVIDGGEGCNIAVEDLMAAFLPAASAASDSAGAGAGAMPSNVNEIEPAAAVGESGAAGSTTSPAASPATSPAGAAAAVATFEASRVGAAGVGSSPLACEERAPTANVVDRTPAAGVAPAGPSRRAVGAALAVGIVRGEGGRSGCCGGAVASGGGNAGGCGAAAARRVSPKEQLRKLKVTLYLEKKTRRRWSKGASYQSRQRVANSRPRHKGRFLPLESDFLPIAEMQRRQRDLMKQRKEKAAAARAATTETQLQRQAPTSPGEGAASGLAPSVGGYLRGRSVAVA